MLVVISVEFQSFFCCKIFIYEIYITSHVIRSASEEGQYRNKQLNTVAWELLCCLPEPMCLHRDHCLLLFSGQQCLLQTFDIGSSPGVRREGQEGGCLYDTMFTARYFNATYRAEYAIDGCKQPSTRTAMRDEGCVQFAVNTVIVGTFAVRCSWTARDREYTPLEV